MNFPEILAGLIRTTLAQSSVSSHERVLLQRYDSNDARKIGESLLGRGPHRATIGLPEDDGSVKSIEISATRLSNAFHTIEVIPFVVVDEPSPDDPDWIGSQGFASRLRTSFALLTSDDVVRVLLLFDDRPVETQQTTASEGLAHSIDSLDSLLEWFLTPEWFTGYDQGVFEEVSKVLTWWRKHLEEDPRWIPESRQSVFERAAAFVESCRSCTGPTEIGDNLPKLGLVFRDPALLSERGVKRLDRNAELAARIDAIRRQRILDPLVEADALLDLGPPGDLFHEAISRALGSSQLVTEVDLTFSDLENRLRSRDRSPAWLDVANMECVSVAADGTPEGPSLDWRLLSELPPPGETANNVDIIVPCPSQQVRLTVPIEGDLRGFLFRDGELVAQAGDDDGGLQPGAVLSIDLSRPDVLSVTELMLREKRPLGGRPPRPTQVLRLGVVVGPHAIVPENSTLDPKRDSLVVDGAADFLMVQVGPTEFRVETELPPIDGRPVEIEVGEAKFRWAGEDRSPDADEPPTRTKNLRLIELVGLRHSGNPVLGQPYFLESGELGATFRTTASLDVPAAWLQDEAALLATPRDFVGVSEDNAAARTELDRLASTPFNAWIESRVAFFEAVTTACEARLPGVGGKRPSMYLADLRDPILASLAADYVDRYSSLLAEVASKASSNANRALIEPIILCDRAFSSVDALRIAPTHPTSVALLATLQQGLLSKEWPSERDRSAIELLLDRPLLNGVLPWLPWRGETLVTLQRTPLLWRTYGTEGGTLDNSDELGPVIVQKVKRLLSLTPHLNELNQTVFLNIEIGRGDGEYVVEAIRQLEKDKKVSCTFDVAIVCSDPNVEPAIVRFFTGGPSDDGDSPRERLHGFVRVRRLGNVSDRQAHLVFRMEAARASKDPFASMSLSHPLARDTGFAGGLSHEPARFADSTENEVVYTRYLATTNRASQLDPEGEAEHLWGGIWRTRYGAVCGATRHASVGLQSAVADDAVPCQALRQIADQAATSDYDGSFITVHCDPAQGPEFFVGSRTSRSGVFLVECSDRGSPELPGRDIVSVTSRIGPFRAALGTAVSALPAPLHGLVDDEVAKGLLRDINILRGTEVFDFLREISQRSHIHLMDGLDNVLALRFLMSEAGRVPGFIPIVLALKDLTARSDQLSSLRSGMKCDDILVLYLPRDVSDVPVLRYRIVEVKFGERRQQWSKAQKQLSETAQKLLDRLPSSVWKEDSSPTALLLERDLAWAVHEALERYRAFGLLLGDTEMETQWHFRDLFQRLHAGAFELTQYDSAGIVNGTALMLDPTIPGNRIEVKLENATEYITLPRDVIEAILVEPATMIAGLSDAAEVSGSPHHDSTESASPQEVVTGSTVSSPVEGEAIEASDQGLPEARQEDTTFPDEPEPSSAPAIVNDDAPPGESSSVERAGEETVIEPVRPQGAPESHSPIRDAQSEIDAVFDGFVGNHGCVTRLKRSLAIARLEGKRWLEPVGLFGPKSTGKTELARRIARALDVPKVELSETLLRSADDLASKIQETAHNAGAPLRMDHDQSGATILRAPPMIVFIDEVHLLPRRVQESLLKALEPDDRTLLSTIGTIDTHHVTFIVATTDPGDLGDAFKSRVSRFDLREYSLDEIVAILEAHREHRDDLPSQAELFNDECLEIIARVGRQIPRLAIRLMKDASREVSVGLLDPTPSALREQYWNLFGADDRGLRDQDRNYLALLFPDKVVGLDSLSAQLGEGKSTISSDIEPYLLRLGLMERGSGGRSLTYLGRELVPSLQE